MARYDGKFLKGTLGNLAFRKVNGENIVQLKPGRGNVKQTRGTVESGTEFGLISTTAKCIRTVFYPLIQNRYDGKMINRLNSVVGEVIRSNHDAPVLKRNFNNGNVSLLDGFEFNAFSPLRKVLPVMPQTTLLENGHVRVVLPSFDSEAVRTPLEWTHCCVCFLLAVLDFNTGLYRNLWEEEITVLHHQGEVLPHEWVLTDPLPAGAVLMTGVSVEFLQNVRKGDFILNSRAFNPAAIVSVLQVDDNPDASVAGWYKMDGYSMVTTDLAHGLEKKLRKLKK